jgi:hypothetical protein
MHLLSLIYWGYCFSKIKKKKKQWEEKKEQRKILKHIRSPNFLGCNWETACQWHFGAINVVFISVKTWIQLLHTVKLAIRLILAFSLYIASPPFTHHIKDLYSHYVPPFYVLCDTFPISLTRPSSLFSRSTQPPSLHSNLDLRFNACMSLPPSCIIDSFIPSLIYSWIIQEMVQLFMCSLCIRFF